MFHATFIRTLHFHEHVSCNLMGLNVFHLQNIHSLLTHNESIWNRKVSTSLRDARFSTCQRLAFCFLCIKAFESNYCNCYNGRNVPVKQIYTYICRIMRQPVWWKFVNFFGRSSHWFVQTGIGVMKLAHTVYEAWAQFHKILSKNRASPLIGTKQFRISQW